MPRQFIIFGTDAAGKAAAREAARDAHRAYIRAPNADGVVVALGGPTFDDGGAAMNGSMLVVQAESIDAVRRFVAGDPYSLAELFASVDIREWRCGLLRAELLAA